MPLVQYAAARLLAPYAWDVLGRLVNGRNAALAIVLAEFARRWA
jgi:hypothetical protein